MCIFQKDTAGNVEYVHLNVWHADHLSEDTIMLEKYKKEQHTFAKEIIVH